MKPFKILVFGYAALIAAGMLGLGEYDLEKIDHRHLELA